MKRVLIHNQHMMGVGQYFLSRYLAQALSRQFKITLVSGGRPVPNQPALGADFVQLEPIYTNDAFLIVPSDPDLDLEEALERRGRLLLETVDRIKPDVFVVDFFPFDRWFLRNEIEAAIARVKSHNPDAKIVCSVLDIPPRSGPVLATGPTQTHVGRAYYDEVIPTLNTLFDLVLVHGDPWLTRLEEHFPWVPDIDTPIRYTGYVGPDDNAYDRVEREDVVLVNAAGGYKGSAVAHLVTSAWEMLSKEIRDQYRLEVIVGAYAEVDGSLKDKIREFGTLHDFIPDYTRKLAGSALSISTAGYNSCVANLITRTRCIYLPSRSMGDQEYRVHRLKELGHCNFILESETSPQKLAEMIARGLSLGPAHHNINTEGASESCRAIQELLIEKPSGVPYARGKGKRGVLFLNDFGGLGGGETWAVRMAKALQKRGHYCAIGAPRMARLHNLSGSDFDHFVSPSLDAVTFVDSLRRFVERHKIDIILSNLGDVSLHAWTLDEMCREMDDPPAVMIKLGVPPVDESLSRHYGYGLSPSFRCLLNVCEHNRKLYLRKFPRMAPGYVKVLYTGIDLESFHPDSDGVDDADARERLGIGPEASIILNVSRIEHHKGQWTLVQAVGTLLQASPDTHLVFIGQGPSADINGLRAAALGLGVSDRVHILLSERDVRPFLKAADVYVQPSFVEGIPNAMIEAMAMGKPCVCTDVCGIPEVIEDGKNGLLVKAADIDGLRSAIDRVLADSDFAQTLGDAAREHVAAFSIDQRARELETLMEDAVHPGARLSAKITRHRPRRIRKASLKNVKSVLISHAEGMGDSVQAFPFFHLARQVFSDQKITLLAPASRSRLFTHFAFDRHVDWEAGQPDWSEQLASENFEIAFDLNLRPHLNPAAALRVDRLVSFRKEQYPRERSTFQLCRKYDLWRQFVGLLRPFGMGDVEIPWRAIRPEVTAVEQEVADRLLESAGGRPLVGVSPGGFSTVNKHWPVDRFAEVLNTLASKLDAIPVLFGHFKEVALTIDLDTMLNCETINLSNRYPGFGVLLALLKRLDLHLTNDNGVMHLADVSDTPQVVLFGHTDYRFFGPMGTKSKLIVDKSGNMDQISSTSVVNACKEILTTGRQ